MILAAEIKYSHPQEIYWEEQACHEEVILWQKEPPHGDVFLIKVCYSNQYNKNLARISETNHYHLF